MYEARQNKEKVSRTIPFMKKKCDNNITENLMQRYVERHNYIRSDDKSIYLLNRHKICADLDKLKKSNDQLKNANSKIELVAQNDTYRVKKNNQECIYYGITAKYKEQIGDEMTITSDCGDCYSIVSGDNIVKETYKIRGENKSLPARDDHSLTAFKSDIKRFFSSLSDTRINVLKTEVGLFNEICNSFSIMTPREIINALTSDLLQQIASRSITLSKMLNINFSVSPTIGEGYKIQTGGDSMAAQKSDWNYHFAAVVMESDDKTDKITLENYAYANDIIENNEWGFYIYGTRNPEQTFHAAHILSGLHGDAPTTFLVGTDRKAE